MEKVIAYRIQQIRRGEVPEGYRKTQWGVAPLTWSRQTIGELCKISSGSTPSRNNPNYYTGDILWVTSGELKSKYLLDTLEKISSDAVTVGKLTLYDPGTVVIAIYGLEAEGVRGTASIIAQRCTISQACMAFTRFRSVLNEFFYYWYMLNGQKIGTRFAQGTKQQNLSSEIVAAFPVDFPELEEQQRIVEILVTQDKMIELQQRKLDEIKKLKKAYLGKMFPKRGSNVPEIRFREFSNPWEQRKVGDVLNESRDIGHSGDIAKKLTVKLWGKGVYAKNDKGSVATQYFTRHAGQFIYSKLDFLNSAFGVVPKELENYESTADLPAFDCIGINPYFMFYRAIQPSFYLANGMIADGSRKAKRVHGETFLDMPLALPTTEEQNKIVNCFTQFDNLITLHQRKLDEMKKLKKTLIKLLMTGIVRVKS